MSKSSSKVSNENKRNVFLAQTCLKMDFEGLNFKNLTPDLEPALPRYHVCQFSGKTNNFDFFSPNLLENEFWCQNFKKLSPNLESEPLDIMCDNFQAKRTSLNFLSQTCLKIDLELEI